MSRALKFIVAALLLAAGTPAFAQFNFDTLKILLTPERPRGNQEVTAVVADNSNDLVRSNITWSVNGRVVKRGTGEMSVSFRTGNIGSATRLTVRVINPAGIPFEKTISIRPADVELLYEAVNTYTPPFYRGKTLPSYEGDVRVVAIPTFIGQNGSRISSRNLAFTWKEGGRVLQYASGVGRDSFILSGKTPFRPAPVSVEVSTSDQAIIAAGSAFIGQRQPTAVLYEDHPLYGTLWNRAIEPDSSLRNGEVRLLAAPFFFSASDISRLNFTWFMNRQRVGATGASVVFRNEGSGGGDALVGVEVQNPEKIFQGAGVHTMLRFEAPAGVLPVR